MCTPPLPLVRTVPAAGIARWVSYGTFDVRLANTRRVFTTESTGAFARRSTRENLRKRESSQWETMPVETDVGVKEKREGVYYCSS